MKELIINESNLREEEINSVIGRAKLIVENSNGELLIVKCNNNAYLIGGHVDDTDKNDNETLIREIKEESGVDYDPKVSEPFYRISYYCKDYPKKGMNTKYVGNYYAVKYDLVPDEKNRNLTPGEDEGGFHLEYVSRDKILDELREVYKTCNNKNVLKDTILVIEDYLKR